MPSFLIQSHTCQKEDYLLRMLGAAVGVAGGMLVNAWERQQAQEYTHTLGDPVEIKPGESFSMHLTAAKSDIIITNLFDRSLNAYPDAITKSFPEPCQGDGTTILIDLTPAVSITQEGTLLYGRENLEVGEKLAYTDITPVGSHVVVAAGAFIEYAKVKGAHYPSELLRFYGVDREVTPLDEFYKITIDHESVAHGCLWLDEDKAYSMEAQALDRNGPNGLVPAQFAPMQFYPQSLLPMAILLGLRLFQHFAVPKGSGKEKNRKRH